MMAEQQLHVAVVQYLRLALPPGALFHHSPLEGKRGPRAQRDLKASGAQRGWPDLEIVHNERAYVVELKALGRHPTPAQRATLAALEAAGCPAIVWRDVEGVAAFLGRYMRLRAALKGWGLAR